MRDIDQAFIHAYQSEPNLRAEPPLPTPHLQFTTGREAPPEASQYAAPAFHPPPVASSQACEPAAPSFPPKSSSPPPQREMRPLSSFSAPAAEPQQAFHPVFEVDAFRWPTVCRQLLSEHQTLLAPVAEQLVAMASEGRTLTGIAGARENVGSTTVTLCLAKLLAGAGKRVALVDGDFVHCSLGQSLGLQFDTGWEDVLAGRAPLAECMIHALDDNLSLLPLKGTGMSAIDLLSGIQTSITAGVLRYQYDLVLFDLGAAAMLPQRTAATLIRDHCRVDASIVVAHQQGNGDVEVNQLMSLLGNTCLGFVGNFAA